MTTVPTTTQTGTPVPSDEHSLTAGANGATALHDRYLVEKLAQFARERIPERVVHAKGGGAHGTFEVTEDVSQYTRAAVFQPGAVTDTLQRFSSVAGEQGSPDTWRDVRGFSVKFYTTEGNYDIVGNNTPVFFIRDGIKFPDFIHSQKRLPGSGLRDADMQWDFWTLSPESAHQVTYLMGDRGLPRSWREMPGFGSHTYQWINAEGERFWVKYHFTSNQGNVEMDGSDAELIAGADADYYRRDLYEAIAAGNFPSWDVHVQVMPYEDAKTYRFNPFDLTKVWPHNAHTLSAIYHIAGQNYYPGQYEFQCLHGMGEPLYEQVVGKVSEGKLNRPCRVYAPVGTHETLLAYLVRRLLENGANTSFVNRIADHTISIQELVADPVASIEQMATLEGGFGLPHPRIPLPRDLYGSDRANSAGIDLANEHRLASLSCALLATAHNDWKAAPMLGCASSNEPAAPVLNPSDLRDVVGHVQEATVEDVDNAIQCAINAGPIWQATPPAERAAILERAADLMEGEIQPLMGLLAREAGKTFANAIAEVREAVDFLRYYAVQARNDFSNDAHRPLGPVVCISPWNFPLAIFSGQVTAALAATAD